MSPPSEVSTKLDLKPLPASLRYEFLDEKKTFPVIIGAQLNQEETAKLLEKLRLHRGALGYSIHDIKGPNPAIYMHNINLEDDHTLVTKEPVISMSLAGIAEGTFFQPLKL